MRRYSTPTAIGAAFLFFTLLPFSTVNAADTNPSRRRDQMRALAEEKIAVAREEAAIAHDSLNLEERRAALAERKASLARQEAQFVTSHPTQTSQLEQRLTDLGARETDRGLVLTLGDVLFESGQAKLTPDAMRKLYPLAAILKENPNRQINIEGHTDSSGSASINRELSQQRADAVRDFLVSVGVTPERITARGYGETNPVASNTNEEGRRENRRVEIVVMREGDYVAAR